MVISILNWNGWRDTLECLESVLKQDYPNFLIVVVDNGSRDDSTARIKAWAKEHLGPCRVLAEYTREAALAGGDYEHERALNHVVSPSRMVLIRNEENLGFTGGNNVAIHYATHRSMPADYLFLLNNDALVQPACLNRLVSAAGACNAGIAGPMFTGPSGSSGRGGWMPAGWERRLCREFSRFERGQGFSDVGAVRGAAMLLDRGLLEAVLSRWDSYLPRGFFMYAEDTALSRRAWKLGRRCVLVEDAIVQHKGARSAGGKFNPIEYYYCRRNLLLLYQEMPFLQRNLYRGLLFSRALASIGKALMRGRPVVARAISAGLFDGARGVTGKWKHHDRMAPPSRSARTGDIPS